MYVSCVRATFQADTTNFTDTDTGTDREDDPELHEIQRNTQTQTLAGTDTDQSDPERGTQTKQKKYG